MTEPLPPLNPDPAKTWKETLDSARALVKEIGIVVAAITGLVGLCLSYYHGGTQKQILQDVNNAKDVQSKIVAVEVGQDPKAFDALKQVDANLKAATQPAK